MTYGDDRTAGAMGDDERRDYVRQDGAAMAAPPDGPSRDLRERLAERLYEKRYGDHRLSDAPPAKQAIYRADADFLFDVVGRSGHVIVRERAIGDALSDAIMEATNHGWNDPVLLRHDKTTGRYWETVGW